ncbi:MAG TPA: FHA domain-containing protein, partial [Mycobacterium sp.]|nr:FHA domain-containing protein [Mycobacterium sp.]
MSRLAPPVLTVRHNGSQRSFAAGHEVVVGRDSHADVRIADPRISRAHLIVRFDQGRWLAIDNGSLNGTYLNGYRMPVIDIHDGQSINVGNPHGPQLTFAIGPQQGHASRLGRTQLTQDPGPPTLTWSVLPDETNPTQPPPGPRGQSGSQTTNPIRNGPRAAPSRPMPPKQAAGPTNPPLRQPVSQPHQAPPPPRMPTSGMPSRDIPPDPPTVVNTGAPAQQDAAPSAEFTVIDAKTADVSNLATRMVKFLTPRSTGTHGRVDKARAVTIGRAAGNDIVVSDVLASRQHATLVQTSLGTEIRDNSINGTFVNGTRVGSAILTEDDVVTIGNVDLVFRDGTLLPRTEAASRTGGLEVREVKYVVDNGKQLLDDISLSARPGTLTAVIGGSGAGKSTLARLIAGYARPTSGSVSFEGHDIHAEYASLRSRIGMVP